jgi:LEA14-like dessication related protein
MKNGFTFASKLRRMPAMLLLGTLLGGCAALSGLNEPPRVSLVSIVPANIQLFEQRFLVTLKVQNPNAEDITIRGLDYTIEVNDKIFAQGVSGKPITIAAYGEGLAEVEVTSTLQRFIEQLEAFGLRSTPSIDYAISGHVNVDGIPISIPFEYENTLMLPGFEEHKGKSGDPRLPKAKEIAI